MQSLKIVITLLVLIVLGIVVGSNLLPTMTVTILNQPTMTLPIGVWLAISIGLGLLSSSLIQLLLFSERRLLDRQIRQLKSRLQQQDDDVFTYNSAAPKPKSQPDSPPREPTESPEPKKSIFSSYRSNFANNFTKQPSTKPIITDDRDDDWDGESSSSRQADWDDVPLPPRQKQASSPDHNFDIPREQSYPNPRTQTAAKDPEPSPRGDVYDAEFRLIQPPYKEPTEVELDDLEAEEEEFEYSKRDRAENSNFSPSLNTSTSTNRYPPSNNPAEEEDWGFDFDEEDTPVKNSKSRDRKI
jgi:uncharacterized membrane protein YciS (DUF1049 family)